MNAVSPTFSRRILYPVCAVALMWTGFAASGDDNPIQVLAARGTGRTTGHIATITVRNTSDKEAVYKLPVSYIPATGKYQSYVVPAPSATPVRAGQTRQIPVIGYCADIHTPPVPDGTDTSPVSGWIPAGPVPDPQKIPVQAGGVYQPRPPGTEGALRPMFPGTETPVEFTIDSRRHPAAAAPFLVGAAVALEKAYGKLAKDGALATPFSADPARERESVIQQTLWIFAAELDGSTYAKEDFSARLQEQLEKNSGTELAAAPPPVKKQFEAGVDDFWNAFTLVGVEAKVIALADETTDGGDPKGTAVPGEGG